MERIDTLGWLHGFAGMGCTFIELVPNEKYPQRALVHYRHQVGQVGVDSALGWLESRSGVGIILKAPHWVLDADNDRQVDRIVDRLADLGIDPLMVLTARGGHFHFQLPADFSTENLKTYMPAGNDRNGRPIPMDFKFPGTLLVAPGTVRNGFEYAPASSWRLPPVLDPRAILPEGKYWKEPQRPFLVNTRPLKDRLAAARIYLKRDAPTSIYKKHGAITLGGVASHLVVFLGLDPSTAASLLNYGKSSWNSRCAYQDGKPYPWSRAELWDACNSAVGSVPAAGVKAFERRLQRMDEHSKLTALVATLKASITRPQSVRVSVEAVLDTFSWTGLPDLTATALGDELVAQGVKRVKATLKRIMCIPGLDLWAMQGSILEAQRCRQEQEGRLNGCPLLTGRRDLIKQVGSLHRDTMQIENQVSADFAPTTRALLASGAA